MFQSIHELQASIHATLETLNANSGDVKNAMAVARVKARIYSAYTRTLSVQLEHAIRTDRLEKGSALLPNVVLQAEEAPAETAAKPRRVA